MLCGRYLLLVGVALGLSVMAVANAHAATSSPAYPDSTVRRWQTGLLRADRLEHASLAFSSGLAVGVLTRRPGVAAGGAFALGLAKELYDRRSSSFDRRDLLADAVGAALAALATDSLGH